MVEVLCHSFFFRARKNHSQYKKKSYCESNLFQGWPFCGWNKSSTASNLWIKETTFVLWRAVLTKRIRLVLWDANIKMVRKYFFLTCCLHTSRLLAYWRRAAPLHVIQTNANFEWQCTILRQFSYFCAFVFCFQWVKQYWYQLTFSVVPCKKIYVLFLFLSVSPM